MPEGEEEASQRTQAWKNDWKKFRRMLAKLMNTTQPAQKL
jgi:hypothetical protein